MYSHHALYATRPGAKNKNIMGAARVNYYAKSTFQQGIATEKFPFNDFTM